MNIKVPIRLMSILLCLASMSHAQHSLPKAMITIRVVNEEGLAVSNATVYVTFEQGGDAMAGRYIRKKYEAYTDTNGLFIASAKTLGLVRVGVTKEGYYTSSKSMQVGVEGRRHGKWQPWNPTIKMILKTIDNPIPMYAMRVTKELPLFGKPVGFDLEKGDFVAPYGKGLINDFIFTFTGEFKDWRIRDENLVLAFSNKKDGMQEVIRDSNDTSAFKLLKQAPLEGYWDKLTFSKRTSLYKVEKIGIKENQNFIFRVRTLLDKDGNIIGANYGKIYGPIKFGFSDPKKVEISFVYYLNPDGTRNIEFDPKRNLFKNLGPFEEVSEP